jgi:hypothetical protein
VGTRTADPVLRPSAATLSGLHAELIRLLSEGQALPIRLLLQARFLREVLPCREAGWGAFGFPVASSMVRRIAAIRGTGVVSRPPTGAPLQPAPDFGLLAGCGPALLDELSGILEKVVVHGAPPFADETSWSRQVDAARESLRREQTLLRGRLEGNRSGMGEPMEGRPPRANSAPGQPGTSVVPVVLRVQTDRPLATCFEGIQTSCLVRFTIKATLLHRRARQPELTIDGAADPATVAGFEDALACIARLPRGGAPTLDHCWFRIRWDLPRARLLGRSATLACLMAARSAYTVFSPAIAGHVVSDDAAITGDLCEGKVLPVESLELKVRASFYGPTRALVVPAAQMHAALREVGRLTRLHPRRQLLIIGASQVTDLWSDSMVVNASVRAPEQVFRMWLQRMALGRGLTAATIGCFVLLSSFAVRELWLSRRVLSEALWEGEDLLLRNPSGRVYKRLHLPPGFPPFYDQVDAREAGRVVGAFGSDSQGRREAVSIRWSTASDWNHLMGWDSHAREIWRLRSDDGLESTPYRAQLPQWRSFCAAGRNGDGILRLLALRRSTQGSLSVIDLIDANCGRELGHLANRGQLHKMYSEDLDLDGTQEILLTGTDNEAGMGLLVVLDPDRMGPAPTSDHGNRLNWISSPQALSRGVRLAVRFPEDDLMSPERPECRDLEAREGFLQIANYVDASRVVLFTLDLRELGQPRSVRAVLTDVYRWRLASDYPELSDEDLAREEERLAHGLTYLTERGWRPVPVSGAGEQ